MPTLAPIAAYDIDPDGKARPVGDGPLQSGWRWHHLDMSDPALPAWLAGQLDPLVCSALLASETRPRVDPYGEGLIVTLRGVNLNAGADPEDMVSLRMWVTKDRVISVRKRRLMALDEIRAGAEQGNAPATPGAFLVALAAGLSHRIEAVALDLEDKVDDLEERSLDAQSTQSHECLPLRQTTIKLRRFLGPQRDALDELTTDRSVLSADQAIHLNESANRTARTVEALESSRERLAAIQDHLDAQTALKMGRNSYILSVMAAIFLPLGFLTGLFGVNVAGMPGTDAAWAFAGLCLVSVVIGAALYGAFRWRGWL